MASGHQEAAASTLADRNALVEVATHLNVALANTYALYMQTQYAHWNVQGPNFIALHQLFESQYKQLASTIDALAERVRALSFRAPGTFRQLIDLSEMQQREDAETDAMLQTLIEGAQVCIVSYKEAMECAERIADQVTEDLLISKVGMLEETIWMLRSSISTHR